MTTSTKQRISRSLLVFLAAIISFSMISSTMVAYAVGESSVEVSNIKKVAEQSAKAQLVAQTFKECMGYMDNYNYMGNGYNYDNIFAEKMDGAIFMYHDVSTGAWLENEVGALGGGADGKILCDSNDVKFMAVFAENIGLDSKKDLFCTETGTSRLFKSNTPGKKCGDPDAEYVFNDEWEVHVSDLYDKYIQSLRDQVGGYAIGATWNETDHYGGVNGYFTYGLEVRHSCGGSVGVTDSPSTEPGSVGSHMSVPIKDVNEYGEIVYDWREGPDTTIVTRNSFVDNTYTDYAHGNGRCIDYVNRMNSDDIAGEYQKAVHAMIAQSCMQTRQEQLTAAKDNLAKQGDDMSDEEKTKAETAIATVEGFGNDPMNYVEDRKDDDGNSTGGLVCKQVDGLADIVQGQYQSSSGNSQEPEDTCYSHSGALGWVACPLIDGLGKVIKEKYVEWVEPALKIDPGLFAGGIDNPTAKAWAVFQTIANIGFVIFMLIIIFSQLTGIGIDNYGIKKTLPRLLVAAILINLSYIICQLVVDISNVFGAGIGSLFVNISNEIDVNNGLVGSAAQSFGSALGWNAVIVGCVAALTAAAVWSQGLALIIPILMVLISVACAVIATMALLGLRQAMAVLLVVFSPLAFLCYMLPNTKSLYDKWFKTFKGLIIAYPVCSAVIFGGDMIGRILLSTVGDGNYWVVISAALISVAPVFAIPKIIEKSMGAIGSMVSGWGRSGGRRLGNMAAGTQVVKHIQQRRGYIQANREQNSLRRRAGLKYDKDGNITRSLIGRAQDSVNGFRDRHKVIGAVTGLAASQANLNALRSTALKNASDRLNENKYTGSMSAAMIDSTFQTSKEKADAQAISDGIAAMKFKFKSNGKSQGMDSFMEEFDSVFDQVSGMGEKDPGRDKALHSLKIAAAALARDGGSEGAKRIMAKAQEGGAAARELANYAVNDNSEVLNAIGKKSMMTQQYLRDMADNSYPDDPGMSYSEWMYADNKNDVRANKENPRTNVQFMADTVIDTDEKLMSQSKDDIRHLAPFKDVGIVERLTNNRELRGKSTDKVEVIIGNGPNSAKESIGKGTDAQSFKDGRAKAASARSDRLRHSSPHPENTPEPTSPGA